VIDRDSPSEYEASIRHAPRFLIVSARGVVVRVQGRTASPDAIGCSWTEVNGRVPERSRTVQMPLLRGASPACRYVFQVAYREGGSVDAQPST
jgi:hypothetical protein